jgi:limonene-1,2-epoxide hydrolase
MGPPLAGLGGEQVSTHLAGGPSSPAQRSASPFLPPQEVSRAFAGALSAGDLDAGASLFAPDACCFVTSDATAIHGPEGIRAVLAQLTANLEEIKARSVTVADRRSR